MAVKKKTGPQPLQQNTLHDDEAVKRVWDTSSLPRGDRFDYFRDGVCRAFFAFSPEKPDHGEIAARIEKTDLPVASIAKIDVTPHLVTRTRADLATIPIDYLSFNVHNGGEIDLDVAGTHHSFRRGDISFVHGNHINNFTLKGPDNYRVISVIFDKALVGNIRSMTNPVVAAIPGDFFWLPFKTCLKLIAERYDTGSLVELTHLFDACMALLKAGVVRDRDFLSDTLNGPSGAQHGMAHLLKRTIQLDISNPNLSLSSIATLFGISSRHIQKLFAKEGTTFRSYVVERRLDHVRDDLLDPAKAHLALSEVAYRWGFRDMTTFHRNFKDQFGDTPRTMRASMFR